MKQDTICWGCKNYAICSWNKGVPVKDWYATPTTLGDIESYCVHSCPQYAPDTKQRYSVKQISQIIGKAKRTTFRYFANKTKTKLLRELLRSKGYILHICKEICNDDGDCASEYYLEKIGGENESN